MREHEENTAGMDKVRLGPAKTEQYSTFTVSGRLYGISVSQVQEVLRAIPVTSVPLAPTYIHGLVNLRGRVATVVGVRELFQLPGRQEEEEKMNVVCTVGAELYSLVVDRIGDVLELDRGLYEPTPATISPHIRRFMTGVYKLPEAILSVVDVEKIVRALEHKAE